MPQIFHRSTNTIAKVSIFGGVFILAFLGWVYSELLRSHYVTGQDVEGAGMLRGLGRDLRGRDGGKARRVHPDPDDKRPDDQHQDRHQQGCHRSPFHKHREPSPSRAATDNCGNLAFVGNIHEYGIAALAVFRN